MTKPKEAVTLHNGSGACWVTRWNDADAVLTVRALFHGLPVTRSLGVGRGGRVYVSEDYRQYKAFVRRALRDVIAGRWADYPMTVKPDEIAVTLSLWAENTARIDLDNALKPVVDACAALWGVDDTIAIVRTVVARYEGDYLRYPLVWYEGEERHRTDAEIRAHEIALNAMYRNENAKAILPYNDAVDWDYDTWA